MGKKGIGNNAKESHLIAIILILIEGADDYKWIHRYRRDANADESHLVAITLLIEGSKGADDGEEDGTQTSEQEVKRARRGTEGPEEDGDNEDLEGNGKSNDDEDYDGHLATKRQGVTKDEATAPP